VIGRTVGHYRVIEQLGQGGMGVVYKAEDLDLGRTVALKFIRPEREGIGLATARFKREAQAAAALNHPNIVTVYEFGEHEGQLYISMELVGGQSLAQLLQGGPLSWQQVVDIASQIGDALSKAHERGIVHRDMKPDNVVVDEDGRVKILDFGVAKPVSGTPALTGEGVLVGTPSYMSPEQARGEPIDHRTDIWSLGVMLFKMVTGRLPYASAPVQGAIGSVLSHPRNRVRDLRPDLPPDLELVLDRALARDPAERYASVSALVADLRALPPPLRDSDPISSGLAQAAPAPESRGRTGTGTTLGPTLRSERRQVTVVSCSLGGRSEAGGGLDPEDLAAVLSESHELCRRVVWRYEGQVTQAAHGLLFIFGYPTAHEDDPRRALLASLHILEGLKRLNERLVRERSLHLVAAIGVDTGLVVVRGDEGPGGHAPVVGDVPSLAIQLSTLASPEAILISEATQRLVEGLFECRTGPPMSAGGSRGSATYEVLHESAARNRLEAEGALRGLAPLVGREKELAILMERWRQAREGEGQVVLLSGEAGIGKSRLVLEAKKQVAGDPQAWMTELRCSPYHTSSAFFPIIDVLERVVLLYERTDAPEVKLRKLEGFLVPYGLPLPEAVPLFAGLLSIPLGEAYAPLNAPPERQKQKALAWMAQMLLAPAAEQPLLVIVEDLHWADPSTLEFLDRLMAQVPATSTLVLLTCRPDFTPPWPLSSQVLHLPLRRLSRSESEALLSGIKGEGALPGGLSTLIMARSDGVPLFIEEMTKMVLESDSAEAASRLEIPGSLHASLTARLDRLGVAKEVAQLAAVLGREFPSEWLQAVSPWDERTLEAGLDRLAKAGLLHRRGVPPKLTYEFKHALIEDAAYQSLLKDKRQAFHRQVAERLSEVFPELEGTSPELLARHLTAAGLDARAIPFWHRAGQQALERSANAEAADHLRRGLELVRKLPEGPERAGEELGLQMDLGVALMSSQGYAAAGTAQAFRRARELCRELGDPPPTFPVLHGLFRFHLVRGEYDVARELGEQLSALAEASGADDLRVEAAWTLPTVQFWTGDLVRAREGLERGLTFYDRGRHGGHAAVYGQDPKVATLSYLGWARAIEDEADEGLSHLAEAVALARELGHHFSLGFALHCTSIVHQLRRDVAATLKGTEEQIAICTELGFPFWAAGGAIIRGWALGESGRHEEGMARMQEGLAGWVATGAELALPYYQHMIADAHRTAGRVADGLRAIEEGFSLAQKTGEAHYLAELHRLRGELLLLRGPTESKEAEACFERAREVARGQGARAWERRAAHSLASLTS